MPIAAKTGKVLPYILSLFVGCILGGIVGAEFIRRMYLSVLDVQVKKTATDSTLTQQSSPTPPVSPRDTTAPSAVFVSRKNAIVIATRKVAPCVVSIAVTQLRVVRSPYYYGDFFDFFFAPDLAPRLKEVPQWGSGFLISSNGLILTNYHVVEEAVKIYVNLPSGLQMPALIVGVDPPSDLALLKIEGENYPYVTFGNSDDCMIGEWVIALGNPFGYFIKDAHPTVTVGVVSALDRNFAPPQDKDVYYQGMIQTDAAINPGNSGGPLVNAIGEVIGINTFIFTGSNSSKGSIGIGFAIPSNRARKVAKELSRYGRRRPVWTGITVQNLNRSIALSLGYDRLDGVVITSIQPGSPGMQTGLQPGDIIVRLGNRSIHSANDIEGFIYDYFVGDTVTTGIIRKGKRENFTLVLKELPPDR